MFSSRKISESLTHRFTVPLFASGRGPPFDRLRALFSASLREDEPFDFRSGP